MAYFNHVYNTDRRVYPTPFHQTLINTDTKFCMDLMTIFDGDLKTFVLNSPVIWTSRYSRECPSNYFEVFNQFMKATYLLLDPRSLKLSRKETVVGVFPQNIDRMKREKWKIELPLSSGFPLFSNHNIPGFFKEFDAIFQVYFCIGS